MRAGWLQVLLIVGSGCCGSPWSIANAPKTQPDIQFREPSATHGNDVYVWNCVDGKHIVVSQYSAEMTCAAPKLETFECGTVSPLELATPVADRTPVPASQRWP